MGLPFKEHEVAAGGSALDRGGARLPGDREPPAPQGCASSSGPHRGAIREVVEPLPAWLRLAERLPDRAAAVDAVHFPEDVESEEAEARRRLAFEELFLLELTLAARRRAAPDGPAGALDRGARASSWTRGSASLPFTLTGDQRRACEAIDADLARERPMQRLLMGEVGSGKTVVALHAMLRAVENGRQAVLMAPTETLAEQHMATLDRLLGGHVPIALLTGSTPAARRRDLLGRLASGELALLVGTHALIEPAVEFRDLALAVVDEQHRFGVRQRAALEAKAAEGWPHALHMTATPIPRTLELTVYGDLDVTALRELPAGRKPVETHVGDTASWRRRGPTSGRARRSRQAARCSWCARSWRSPRCSRPRRRRLRRSDFRRTEFRDQRVALIHGQMSSKDKQEAMRTFASGERRRAGGHQRDRGGHRRAERHA